MKERYDTYQSLFLLGLLHSRLICKIMEIAVTANNRKYMYVYVYVYVYISCLNFI
jgi:hypothetical protein